MPSQKSSAKGSKKKSRGYSGKSKYRSKLEERVASALGRHWEYEAKDAVTSYTLSFDYLPDFYQYVDYGEGDVVKYKIEVKGYFRPGDIKKYAGVIKAIQATKDEVLIFVFDDPNKPVRKGAKMTMAQWAEKHEVMWFAANDIHSLKKFLSV